MVTTGRAARALGLILAVLLAAAGRAQDGGLSATVDRATVRENESFTYVLRAEGRVSGQPDLSVFESDFDVLDRRTSTRIQSINGRTDQVAEWTVQLMPRAPGRFTLPAVQLGDQLSNPVMIEVLPAPVAADAPADIFMEVEVDRESAYVQSQVVYTLRLFVGIGTGRATLTAPLISGGEAIVERLGEDRQFQTTRGDRNFIVRERRYAVFPQQSGRLTIGPSTFEAMVIPNRGFSRVQRLRSDAIEVEVRPPVAPPATHPDAVWLPARQLTLRERWADQSPVFSMGVPRTRVLSIVADGLLETQLPELELGRAEGIRQYPDQPELERQITDAGIEATRIERYAVIAQAEGEVTIPAAEVPWWNVDDERWEVARVEARELPVVPGDVVEPAPLPQPTAEASAPVIAEAEPSRLWPWLSGALGTGWLLTVLAWWARHRSRAARPSPAPAPARPLSGRALFKQLRAACAADDAERAQRLLLDWARLQYADDPPGSLGALAERLSGPLREEAAALEAHLYGRGGSEWSGARLSKLLSRIGLVTRSGREQGSDPLLPLYR